MKNSKIFIKTLTLIIIIIISFTVVYTSADKVKDPFPEIPFIIYPDAYDIKTNIDEKKEIKWVAYKVNISFPAIAVIDYYDKKLSELGFIPYLKNSYGMRMV